MMRNMYRDGERLIKRVKGEKEKVEGREKESTERAKKREREKVGERERKRKIYYS